MDEKLLEFLNFLQKSYGAYIGKKNLERLITFISGYIHGVYVERGIRLQFLPGFQKFVENYYDLKDNIHVFRHWSGIISFFNSTEDEAFDEFYILLNEFLNGDTADDTEGT